MFIAELREHLETCRDLAGIIKITGRYIAPFGGSFFAAITFGMEGTEWSPRNPYGLISHPWTMHYVNRRFNRNDASIRMALSLENENEPLRWSEARAQGAESDQIVFIEAEAFGLKEGLVVPLRNPNGSISLFSIAGEHFNPSEEDVGIISRAAHYIHKRAMQIMQQDEGVKVPGLTQRQNEVMKLLIEGKSAGVIAELLGISEDTVKDHRKTIYQKLQASDVKEAAFRAFQTAAYTPPTP